MKIKDAIKAQGSNLSEVAKNLGITQSALSQTINNETITLKRVQEIAKVLHCSVAALVDDNAAETDTINIVCPHCHHTISLKISEKPQE